MKNIIKDFLYLDRFYNLISNRYSKRIMWFLNSVFGFLTSILCLYSFQLVTKNQTEMSSILFLSSISVVIFSELINISYKNSYKSIFTLDRIDIYPISKFEHLKNLFISNYFNSRLIYFIVLLFLVIYYSINFSALYLIQVSIIFMLFYFFATLIFTLADYGYALLVKLFGKKANFFLMGFILIPMLSKSIINKLDIDLEMEEILIKLSHLINFILNDANSQI